jgi:predicted DsbA family dithiol-disulfide isomerase
MNVEIWSDVVCPWCYVGKKRFERALEAIPWRDEIEVRYRPFELDPRVSAAGEDLDAYLAQKYGDVSRVRAGHAHLTSAGVELGIDFRWAGMRRPNTFDAHRTLEWALATAGPVPQAAFKERLMRAYFTDGLDVGDRAVLAELASEVGLDPTAARQVLDDGEYADEVRFGEAEAASLGLNAVPTFVIERQLAIPGAQDVGTFRQYLDRARERLVTVPIADGAACSPDDPDGC